MRAVMAMRWLGVAAVVAVACLVAVTAEEPRAVGEVVAVHRHFPRERRFSVTAKEEVGVHRGEVERAEGDGERMQWKFQPLNPFQTFGVRREGHGHRKCGMAAKLRSWWSNRFGHHHDHGFHHHHHGEEHRREHDHEHRFERDMEYHHMHHHRHLGWGLLRKIGRWFSGIPSFISDMPTLIRTWSARVGGRKPPTVESVTEPLDMHALQKPSSPSLSCTLREKLSHVFAAVAEEAAVTTDVTENGDSQSDVIKRNLKKFMGDSMQLRIVKSICDTASLSSCEQEFCDVFLSHPKSGVLMAFRVLGLNPVRAAINPKGVATGLLSSKPLVRPGLSPNERDMIVNLRKTHRLAHVISQRVLEAIPTEESVKDFMSQEPKGFMIKRRFGGEMNPCKACLRQEIFRFKKLTKKALIEVCENPADSHLEQSCHFVNENRFLFKTLFAYKFRFWERAAFVCRNRKACDSPFTPSTNAYELASNTLVRGAETHNLRLAHFDVNTFRNPRGVAVAPFMTSSMHGKGLNCRQRALHRAAMLRGHALDAIASELLKADDSLSLQREHGPIIVVEFMARPLGVSSFQKVNFFHRAVNMEPGTMQNFEEKFASLVDSERLSEILKKPLIDSSPVRTDEVMEDAIAKPHDVQDVPSLITYPELLSSVEFNARYLDT